VSAHRPTSEFWSHFQTEHTEVFASSATRLDFLLRLAKRISPGPSLLNIGCGDGYLERRALQSNWKVLSVDPDAKSADRLKSMGIDARCGMIESLPVAPASLDVVVCTEVLEHLTPAAMAAGLREIQRVLVPGGVLIGTVPYRENLADNQVFCPHCHEKFHRWGHQQSFDESRMRAVLREYFSVRKVRPIYIPAWNTLDCKGKLSSSARLVFSFLGVFSASANLLFIAARGRPADSPQPPAPARS